MGECKAYLYNDSLISKVQEFSFNEFVEAFVGGIRGNDSFNIIAGSSEILNRLECPDWLPATQQRKWEVFFKKSKKAYSQFCQAQSLASPEKPQMRDMFHFLWPRLDSTGLDHPRSFIKSKKEEHFIALIAACSTDISYLTIWGYLFFLTTQWHVEHGGLSLHSSAVARNNDGFLFLGRSKAGKTTVTELSESIGLSTLGDDLNFIISDARNGYRLAAAPSPKVSQVGYSMQKPKLCGIFTLVQDKSDYLVPITPIKLAPILFDSFIQQTPYVNRVADNLVGKAFQTICAVARQIPGYELHFRKSPDFWKLIDEQFPG